MVDLPWSLRSLLVLCLVFLRHSCRLAVCLLHRSSFCSYVVVYIHETHTDHASLCVYVSMGGEHNSKPWVKSCIESGGWGGGHSLYLAKSRILHTDRDCTFWSDLPESGLSGILPNIVQWSQHSPLKRTSERASCSTISKGNRKRLPMRASNLDRSNEGALKLKIDYRNREYYKMESLAVELPWS